MTFQEIINMIRTTAETVNPTGSFIHGRNSDAANTPEKAYPRIHLYPFKRKRAKNNIHHRTSDLLIAFVKQDSGDNDVEEREEIIAEMDVLCGAFLESLEDVYDTAIQFDDITEEPQYNILEGVSGYALQLRIITINGC